MAGKHRADRSKKSYGADAQLCAYAHADEVRHAAPPETTGTQLHESLEKLARILAKPEQSK